MQSTSGGRERKQGCRAEGGGQVTGPKLYILLSPCFTEETTAAQRVLLKGNGSQ